MRIVLASLVSGFVCFVGTVFVLMELGLRRHGNYEYYSQDPGLYVVPGIMGLLLPFVVSLLRNAKWPGSDT